MTPKQQAAALKFLQRWLVYSEDWKADTTPNGVKLREETKTFMELAEAEEPKKDPKA